MRYLNAQLINYKKKYFIKIFFLQCFVIILLVLIGNQVHRKFLDNIYHTKGSSKIIDVINTDPPTQVQLKDYTSFVLPFFNF